LRAASDAWDCPFASRRYTGLRSYPWTCVSGLWPASAALL
jgi:hypothetical protein